MCLVVITCALRWRVTHVGDYHYWALLTLSRLKLFQVPKVHLGMGHIRGLRDEEMVIYGLVMYFVKIWVKDPVLDNCKSTHFCIKYTFL